MKPNLEQPLDVNCQFVAAGPHRLWVAEVTCVPMATGFVDVAFVTDVFARCIV